MMHESIETLINMISQIIWPMWRIGGMLLTVPVFSSVLIPSRVKLVLMATLALVVSPLIPADLSLLHFKPYWLVYVLAELALGVMMGFIIELVFQIFILGGQVIAMQAGLGFATMIDPASRASVPLVSQLYLIMITLVFLSLDGHLALFNALMESFQLLPIGHVVMDNNKIWSVLGFSGWMFQEAVLVSIPAILSLLIVSIAFGVMTRVAPQLNIFAIGFPITLLMGMIIIRFSLPGAAFQMSDSLEQGMKLILTVLR